jgi:hypothetical protein
VQLAQSRQAFTGARGRIAGGGADALGSARSLKLPLPGTAGSAVQLVSTVEIFAEGVRRVGAEITEGLLNHIEVAIRAYDPCTPGACGSSNCTLIPGAEFCLLA